MTIDDELLAAIVAIETDASLLLEGHFISRTEALDLLEFPILEMLESSLQHGEVSPERLQWKARAIVIRQSLGAIQERVFRGLQKEIRDGTLRGPQFMQKMLEFVPTAYFPDLQEEGYDYLDDWINGVLPITGVPEQTKEPGPEMVFYQKTPARVVLETVRQLALGKEDVFFDIGSGLGQVCMLVHLLTGAPCTGIELEPAFCACAAEAALDLQLPGVTFLNMDARQADYAAGTVFFLYTPFRGQLLRQVLERLRLESLHRKIRVVTYGPCTMEVAKQDWLSPSLSLAEVPGTIGVFQSA